MSAYLIWPIGPIVLAAVFAAAVAYCQLVRLPHEARKLQGRVSGAMLGWYTRALIESDRRSVKVGQ